MLRKIIRRQVSAVGDLWESHKPEKSDAASECCGKTRNLFRHGTHQPQSGGQIMALLHFSGIIRPLCWLAAQCGYAESVRPL